MRTDVKLGLAVGSVLFGVVLVYVLFVAGGGNVAEQQAKDPSPTVQATAAASADQQRTSTAQTIASTAGDSHLAAGRIGAGGSGPTVTITASSTPKDMTAAGSAHASAQPPAARQGGWNWDDALSRGAAGELLAHSQTPTAPPPNSTLTTATDPSTPVVSPASVIAPPSRTAARTYQVKAGDSFWSIAKAVYGSASYYPHLARANPNIDPARLKAGATINLPSKDEVVPSSATAVAGSGAVAPAARPVDPGTQYRVQSGDSLQAISKRLYGKADRWDKLYQLNKEAIGPNPSALKLNMVLQLPEPPNSISPMAGPIQ